MRAQLFFALSHNFFFTNKHIEYHDSMKVFISVDIEGISGIVDNIMTSRTQGDYEKGRSLMVGDVNSAIEGILSLGPAEITVSDARASKIN